MADGRKLLKRIGRTLGIFLLLILVGILYIVFVTRTDPPEIADDSPLGWPRTENDPDFYSLKNSWFRKSESGLYELYVEGKPYERGVVNGKLTRELLQKQEAYFNDRINKMIPSTFYLHFLKYFVGWFNRNLNKYVAQEYKEEIYGVSASASDKYKYIGSNYQRILNYHAAHDIGHALQNLALVGCTSFGTWGDKSAGGNLIIGRNFDFYAGDHFSENKIVAFVNPSEGHQFMSVTWGGFIGVVSGMNDKGLTVTINAAKSSIPRSAATPVSLLAREVLQYAENLSEAIAIAGKRKMFVSESFLVGSAEDGKAVIIEKTPDSLAVYDPGENYIVCTNHFQSKEFGQSKSNRVQMKESASEYRYQRLQELLDRTKQNTVERTAAILRDRKGIRDADIGIGNEKAIDQLIAHHSIIFEPEKRLVWVSTAPWQLGKYVCYDLKKVFSLAGMKTSREVADSSLEIPPDPFLLTSQYQDFLRFRKYKEEVMDGQPVDPDILVTSNPDFYQSYELAGNELFKSKDYRRAADYYRQALTKVIATRPEEDYIRKQIKKAEEKAK